MPAAAGHRRRPAQARAEQDRAVAAARLATITSELKYRDHVMPLPLFHPAHWPTQVRMGGSSDVQAVKARTPRRARPRPAACRQES
jgi:hypothetical protein